MATKETVEKNVKKTTVEKSVEKTIVEKPVEKPSKKENIAKKFKVSKNKKKAFEERYENVNYDELEYIMCYNDEPNLTKYYLFKYDDNNSFYYSDEADEWYHITKIKISSDGIETSLNCDDIDIPECKINNDKKVIYEFYPAVDQMDVPDLKFLNLNKKKLIELNDCDKEYDDDNDSYTHEFVIGDNIKIVVNEKNHIDYKIYKNKKLIAHFIDEQTTYQLGDGGTVIYTHSDRDVVMQNVGDVSSVIIIRNIL